MGARAAWADGAVDSSAQVAAVMKVVEVLVEGKKAKSAEL
jgi:hypothetical protein